MISTNHYVYASHYVPNQLLSHFDFFLCVSRSVTVSNWRSKTTANILFHLFPRQTTGWTTDHRRDHRPQDGLYCILGNLLCLGSQTIPVIFTFNWLTRSPATKTHCDPQSEEALDPVILFCLGFEIGQVAIDKAVDMEANRPLEGVADGWVVTISTYFVLLEERVSFLFFSQKAIVTLSGSMDCDVTLSSDVFGANTSSTST